MELNIVEGIYPLHTITHTHPLRPLIIVEWPLPLLPVELFHLVERAVWQHLNWHYVPLTRSTVTYRSSWKRLTWPQYPRVTMTKRRVLTRHVLIGFLLCWWQYTSVSVEKALLCCDNQMGSLCNSQSIFSKTHTAFRSRLRRTCVDLMKA